MVVLVFQKTFILLLPLLLLNPFNNSLSFEPGKCRQDTSKEKTGYRIKTIVVDAGHGGHDPGCLGSGSREKDVALAIALKVSQGIRSQYPQIKVILTRESDVFIPLHERADIANKNDADLFISIHCNYIPTNQSRAHGTETYVMGLHTEKYNLEVAKRENASILLEDDYQKHYDYDPNSPEAHILLSMFQHAFLEQSILFADKVERQFKGLNRKSRGVKQAGFLVLRRTVMPSVLIETGFLSHQEEEGFLLEEAGQANIAQAIVTAFTEYKTVVEAGSADIAAEAGNTLPYPSGAKAVEVKTTELNSTGNITSITYNTPAQPVYEDNPIRGESKIITLKGTQISPPAVNGNPSATEELQSKGLEWVTFRVQLASAQAPADIGGTKWQNLPCLVELNIEGSTYKYQSQGFDSHQEALEMRKKLQESGFPDAFIVAYRGKNRIPLDEAIKQRSSKE